MKDCVISINISSSKQLKSLHIEFDENGISNGGSPVTINPVTPNVVSSSVGSSKVPDEDDKVVIRSEKNNSTNKKNNDTVVVDDDDDDDDSEGISESFKNFSC